MACCEDDVCPLCAENLDATDKAVRYCPCGYSMCLWCFNTVMETASKESLPARCPNCRAEYVKENITMTQIDTDT
jgi:CCR4-NOT transcription complex subunit 4